MYGRTSSMFAAVDLENAIRAAWLGLGRTGDAVFELQCTTECSWIANRVLHPDGQLEAGPSRQSTSEVSTLSIRQVAASPNRRKDAPAMNLVHITASTFFGGPERQILGLAQRLADL